MRDGVALIEQSEVYQSDPPWIYTHWWSCVSLSAKTTREAISLKPCVVSVVLSPRYVVMYWRARSFANKVSHTTKAKVAHTNILHEFIFFQKDIPH